MNEGQAAMHACNTLTTGFSRQWPTRRSAMLGATALAITASLLDKASAQSTVIIDQWAARGLRLFETPGLSLAIVQDGRPTIARGYGVRRLGSGGRVDDATVFPIASLTKAFTSAAMAVLVADGKLSWDDKVVDRLPGFKLYDSVATREMNVRDLLCHRSGLGLGEGDLMLFPPTTFTRPELVAKLRYLKPAGEFRDGFNYDNVLYIAAGELIGHLSGQSWESFIQDRILTPAGMSDSAPAIRMLKTANRAGLHARIAGPIRGLGPVEALPKDNGTDLTNPAGGLQASARDMAKWMALQLSGGILPSGRRLWSQDSADTMWRPVTVVDTTLGPVNPDTDPHFMLSALGWAALDYRGIPVLMHAGEMPGMCSRLMLVPSRRFGFYIGLNSEEETLHESLAYSLLDRELALATRDYLAAGQAQDRARRERMLARAEKAKVIRPSAASAPSLPLAGYSGTYRSEWYGDVIVRNDAGGLSIDFTRTPSMKGPLLAWDGETFITRFPDRDVENALVTFTKGSNGRITGATMKRASPAADPSYDYQDLALIRLI